MKKINNLNELSQLIGDEAIEKCFMENFMMLTERARRQRALENNCAVMNEQEMTDYIDNVGRPELFDEIKDLYSSKDTFVRPGCPYPYPRFLKAVMVSLVAQGYDEQWVDTEFRQALENKYLPKE